MDCPLCIRWVKGGRASLIYGVGADASERRQSLLVAECFRLNAQQICIINKCMERVELDDHGQRQGHGDAAGEAIISMFRYSGPSLVPCLRRQDEFTRRE